MRNCKLLLLTSLLNAVSALRVSRRSAIAAVGSVGVTTAMAPPARASVKSDAETVLASLAPIPGYIDEAKWDGVRTVLKTSPVVELWNLGNSKNWLRKSALDAGDPDLIELTEDLSSALQLTDQYVYDNNFIYFQPGNGKLKTKEPKDQISIAQKKLKQIIAVL
eukprot:CAMPEP_0119269782 /NCGR_PEP_ID=MMETSP1329-20130426/7046_1 /TAXON_ID=114041 /ORGANISM="Genus nov. species nov., Strain RCC1024" /LENGTH=163 /DNA_ID=CAMNT_0007269783 /DNA_START=156 /DNA_END=647 /DNA_ORIENTATION=-